MTDPVPAKPRRKPGPPKVKGDLAVLALKRAYEGAADEKKTLIRAIVGAGLNPVTFAEIAEAAYDLEPDSAISDTLAWFDLIDKRQP